MAHLKKLLTNRYQTLKAYKLSTEGLDALHKKREELRARKRVVSRTLTELNDQPSSTSAEDQTWIEAMNELHYIENELEKVGTILSHYKLIRKPKRAHRVTVGSIVELVSPRKKMRYTIVGSLEANPFEGKISDESPFGRLLLGKRVGDIIDFPKKSTKFKAMRLKLEAIK